jgi:hypothetical protein
LDFALAQTIVDPARIALMGWSLGGYLAPRAASEQNRLAALIADPGQWGIAWGFREFAIRLGAAPQTIANLGEIDQSLLDDMTDVIAKDRRLYWSVVQRGFWVHGVDNLRDYLRSAELFTLEGRAELIKCPTLLTLAEGDPLTASTQRVFDTLHCPKTLMRFTVAEGAGGHVEVANRSLLNRRVLDWLDDCDRRSRCACGVGVRGCEPPTGDKCATVLTSGKVWCSPSSPSSPCSRATARCAWLRVAPLLPIPSAARRDLGNARSGRESRLADRTGKPVCVTPQAPGPA